MKTILQKSTATMLMLIIVLMTSTAFGAVTGGEALDILIPRCDSLLDTLSEFLSDTYTVSEESLLGKAGTVFIDMDKAEIKIIGKELFRKYTCSDTDDISFVVLVGTYLYAIDNSSATDYGVNVFVIEDGDTELLDAKEISLLAAQFVTALTK